MMDFMNKRRAECRGFRMQLEDAAGAAPSAKELSELLALAPTTLKEHAIACADCRAAAENILAARALLAVLPSYAATAGPWFAPRVMAAIAARKAELSRAADTWTFLPKLAARLTWASSIALLLASAWLYQKPPIMPAATTTAKSVATDIAGDPVVDPATQSNGDDEIVLSLAEKQHR
ncbi:MAG TPA: hypothetical protein VKH63_03850 [Candidatus Acidoferrum sp.]|nr:hypothetical protein [Candidatus Acidoferrum sp.]